MMIFTIGFTKKSAKQFFNLIKENNIDLLLDIRLNNKSQLAGFTKGDDLQYFLSEICHCEYKHCLEYAPSKDILDAYQKKLITWDEYVNRYTALMNQRAEHIDFINQFANYTSICLLCSEPTPEHCHRRLIAEMIANNAPQQIEIKHI
jgi:uncharacterized protein (DUF488 family)